VTDLLAAIFVAFNYIIKFSIMACDRQHIHFDLVKEVDIT